MPRPISRAISSTSLTQDQVRSYAPAHASIAESIAGRVRYLYELATGRAAIADDGVVTPLNPQGLPGVDRSGPPWGDALQHPMWLFEGTFASSTMYGEKPIMSLASNGAVDSIRARLHVRPFQLAALAPYGLGELTIFGLRTGGAGTATATISVYADRTSSGPARTTTLSMSSTTALANAQVMVPLAPGFCERLIKVESTGTPPFAITHMAISQIKRRSH